MDLKDAIALIKHAHFSAPGQKIWADLGCGAGLFAYALANLLETNSTIYAWDKSPVALSRLANPHHVNIKPGQLDFLEDDLPISGLDGIMMANSLHYVADKTSFIDKISTHLRETGAFLIVEYETTNANPWVPYPIPFQSLTTLLRKAGFTTAIKLGERPSVFRAGKMYAALFTR